ncbi:hypothetical protein KIN20_006348 [Parelaphostrongylus tenuis]|uniref:Uncharacterized protein n=1 Tax=Parelaphostrongylus tenuis TaxID=148309 RepID=A0AAD5M4M5_PARTN|nr:hypothetical protein KIN20_006348 [Parelaphostrongylus tenuis]
MTAVLTPPPSYLGLAVEARDSDAACETGETYWLTARNLEKAHITIVKISRIIASSHPYLDDQDQLAYDMSSTIIHELSARKGLPLMDFAGNIKRCDADRVPCPGSHECIGKGMTSVCCERAGTTMMQHQSYVAHLRLPVVVETKTTSKRKANVLNFAVLRVSVTSQQSFSLLTGYSTRRRLWQWASQGRRDETIDIFVSKWSVTSSGTHLPAKNSASTIALEGKPKLCDPDRHDSCPKQYTCQKARNSEHVCCTRPLSCPDGMKTLRENGKTMQPKKEKHSSMVTQLLLNLTCSGQRVPEL